MKYLPSDSQPSVQPVPLWPTPWYLRILGFKKWRYRQEKHRYFIFYPSHPVSTKLIWVYVDNVHEIKNYIPVRDK